MGISIRLPQLSSPPQLLHQLSPLIQSLRFFPVQMLRSRFNLVLTLLLFWVHFYLFFSLSIFTFKPSHARLEKQVDKIPNKALEQISHAIETEIVSNKFGLI